MILNDILIVFRRIGVKTTFQKLESANITILTRVSTYLDYHTSRADILKHAILNLNRSKHV